MSTERPAIALIGYGEVGQTLAADIAAAHQPGTEPAGLTERLDAVLASIGPDSGSRNREIA